GGKGRGRRRELGAFWRRGGRRRRWAWGLPAPWRTAASALAADGAGWRVPTRTTTQTQPALVIVTRRGSEVLSGNPAKNDKASVHEQKGQGPGASGQRTSSQAKSVQDRLDNLLSEVPAQL